MKTITYAIAVVIILVIFVGIFTVYYGKNNGTPENQSLSSGVEQKSVKGVSTQDEKATIKEINISEAHELINNNDTLVIVDVRTPEEYNGGHIEKAINIDFYNSDFENNLRTLDKNLPYLIYCRSGNRSNMAKDIFQQMGFKEIYELDGGYNLWQENR